MSRSIAELVTEYRETSDNSMRGLFREVIFNRGVRLEKDVKELIVALETEIEIRELSDKDVTGATRIVESLKGML